MTNINIANLETMVQHLKESTKAALNPSISPVVSQMRDETKEVAELLHKATRDLSMQHLGIMEEGFDLKTKMDSNPEKSVSEAVNWLVQTSTTVVKVLQQHSVILSSLLQHHEKEVVKINDTIQKVEKRALEVEKENNEVRQRSMKGNLVISTDISNGQKSAFVSDKLNANGARSKESELEMVLRLIKDKTGENFKKSEIAACHALGRKKEAD